MIVSEELPLFPVAHEELAKMASTDFDFSSTEIITDLQIELQNANVLTNEIKSENEELKRQLESANAFSKANRQRHMEWKAAWKVEREALSIREKRLEKDEANWKAKLEDLRRESEELEGRKLLKIEGANVHGAGVGMNLLKDIDEENACRTEALANEVNKWRDQCHASRTIYEELQAQYEQLQGRSNRERIAVESIQKEINSLQHALADQIERSDNENTTTTEVMVRDLKYQLVEKELRLEKLQLEVKSMQTARDNAYTAKDELVATHQAELARMMHDVATSKANNLILERRIQATTKEAAQAVAAKSELEESTNSANKELASLRIAIAAKDERYKQEMDRLGKELTQSESRLKVQLTSAHNLLVEEQAKCIELERKCSDIHEFAMKQISDLTKELKQPDDSKEQLIYAKDQITKHEITIVELQRELAHTHQNHQNEVQRLQHACEVCHKDLKLVLFEKNEMDKISAAEKVKVSQLQKLLEESEISTQKLENNYHSIVGEKATLLQRIDELTDENGALRNKLKSTAEDMRLTKEREASGRNEVGKVRKELEKEKIRSNAYKSKALESHRRNVQAKEVLDSLCG